MNDASIEHSHSTQLVSVIVPVYDVEQFLAECLESVSAQTHSHLEIILVNDGSRDRSGIICDEFAAQDARAVVTHQQNSGLAEARNAGIATASGEYLCFVDSDDLVEPDYVERLLATALATNADIAVCGLLRFNIDQPNTVIEVLPETSQTPLTGHEATRYLLGAGHLLMTLAVNKLYRTALFATLRFRGRIHEDDDLAYRILPTATTVAFTPHPLYLYRTRPGSIMTTLWSEKNLRILEINRERLDHFTTTQNDDLAALARRKYLATLLRTHAAVLRSEFPSRHDSLGWIRAEVRRVTSTPIPDMYWYDNLLLKCFRIHPRLAAQIHRVASAVRASAIGMWLFRSAGRRRPYRHRGRFVGWRHSLSLPLGVQRRRDS